MNFWSFTTARWICRPAGRYGPGIAEILGRCYAVREIDLGAGSGTGGSEARFAADVRPMRPGGQPHRVVDGPDFYSCDCPDFILRDKEGRESCKHTAAARLLYPDRFPEGG